MVENRNQNLLIHKLKMKWLRGAIAAVDQAKAQDTSLGNLSSEVDAEYHEGKP